MADNLKEIFEEAGEFAEANNNKLTLADAVVLIAEAYELEMKQLVQNDTKLQAVKHVKESAKCGLKEAKDFVDTYRDYVLND